MANNRVEFEDDQSPTLRGAHRIFNDWLHALQVHDAGMKELFGNFVTVSDDDWAQSDISAPASGSTSLATSPALPSTVLQSVVAPSPRKRFGELLTTLQSKISHAARRSHGDEVMGLRLTAEESLALRYRVLDTLTQYQASVEALISSDTKCMTQWVWLKESLRTQLQNTLF